MTATVDAPRHPLQDPLADRLLKSSARHSYDPGVDIDWDAPIPEGMWGMQPERMSLYGTDLWDRLSEEQRIELSQHEVASIASVGLWFELILMQMMVRDLYDADPRGQHMHYALTEIADECRHSTMFGEFIRRAGTPAYRPAHGSLDVDDLPGRRATSFLLILAVEELLDHINRKTMRDDRVHPVSRQIAKLHVLEEARHVSFAKSYLSEVWPQLSDEERNAIADAAPALVAAVAEFSIDPEVYEHLGIQDGALVAQVNPHHREVIVEGLAKLTGFLAEIGVIDDERRPTWAALGLLAPMPAPVQ